MASEELKRTNLSPTREKKLEYLGTLSSYLIHEIRNPLHHIRGYSYVISHKENLSDEGKEYLSNVDSAVRIKKSIWEYFRQIFLDRLLFLRLKQ